MEKEKAVPLSSIAVAAAKASVRPRWLGRSRGKRGRRIPRWVYISSAGQVRVKPNRTQRSDSRRAPSTHYIQYQPGRELRTNAESE